jgi:hypothetical protein
MKLEEAACIQWGTGCANYWPSFVKIHPLLWLLWAALTQLGGFCLQTLSFSRPHDNCGTRFGYGCHIPQWIGCIV